jgi:hypothetical protein
MNLSIFNFKSQKRIFLRFCLIFIILNLLIYILPNGPVLSLFNSSIKIANDNDSKYEVILFGDSKANMFHNTFFRRKTLTFACPNNGIAYSKYLYDNISELRGKSLKVAIIFLSPNMFNRNGIFVKRDFSTRRLASFSDAFSLAINNIDLSSSLDMIFSKIIPIYGRRMEIRNPRILKNMVLNNYIMNIPYGLREMNYLPDSSNVEGSFELDKKITLIYKRSVYNNYDISDQSIFYLESILSELKRDSITTILVQPPIKREFYILQKQMVGNQFDKILESLLNKNSDLIYLDLRNEDSFQFSDVIHLSDYGAKKITEQIFNPMIEKIIK